MESHEKSEVAILLNLIKNGIEHFLLGILAYVHYPQKKVINSLFRYSALKNALKKISLKNIMKTQHA